MKSKIKELLGKSNRRISHGNEYPARNHNHDRRDHNQDHRDYNQDRSDHDQNRHDHNLDSPKQNKLPDAQLIVIKALEIMEQSQQSMKEEIMKTLRGQ